MRSILIRSGGFLIMLAGVVGAIQATGMDDVTAFLFGGAAGYGWSVVDGWVAVRLRRPESDPRGEG